mmetsp:Transcript_10306/g.15668  ORF Transcript_10306/g.15668 Transcript_10306/m.15668 type:complete len:255 (+) Transcript_10306:62-826(+)
MDTVSPKTYETIQRAYPEWSTSLLGGCCSNLSNCCYATFCPVCALASAKKSFDGSNFCFNCCCFCSPCLVRNYIRNGYGIDGRIGVSDFCIPCACAPCSIAQLLNEVDAQGPRLRSVTGLTEYPWLAPTREHSCSGDPCDFLCTCLFCPCEVIDIYSQLTGSPFWFGAMGCLNVCQLQHIMRKSYGIGGSDWYGDVLKPCLCLAVPGINCIYTYKTLASLRSEIHVRGGKPPNFQALYFDDDGAMRRHADNSQL